MNEDTADDEPGAEVREQVGMISEAEVKKQVSLTSGAEARERVSLTSGAEARGRVSLAWIGQLQLCPALTKQWKLFLLRPGSQASFEQSFN